MSGRGGKLGLGVSVSRITDRSKSPACLATTSPENAVPQVKVSACGKCGGYKGSVVARDLAPIARELEIATTAATCSVSLCFFLCQWNTTGLAGATFFFLSFILSSFFFFFYYIEQIDVVLARRFFSFEIDQRVCLTFGFTQGAAESYVWRRAWMNCCLL